MSTHRQSTPGVDKWKQCGCIKLLNILSIGIIIDIFRWSLEESQSFQATFLGHFLGSLVESRSLGGCFLGSSVESCSVGRHSLRSLVELPFIGLTFCGSIQEKKWEGQGWGIPPAKTVGNFFATPNHGEGVHEVWHQPKLNYVLSLSLSLTPPQLSKTHKSLEILCFQF